MMLMGRSPRTGIPTGFQATPNGSGSPTNDVPENTQAPNGDRIAHAIRAEQSDANPPSVHADIAPQSDLFGVTGHDEVRYATPPGTAFRDPAFMANRHAPVHRWVPWIAGYSKHFVADALARFATEPGVVLDPFSGVGTTLVEADLAGHVAIGFEVNPYAAFAAKTKLKAHRVAPERLREAARSLAVSVKQALADGVAPHWQAPQGFRTRAPFYSANVQHKVLLALDFINALTGREADLLRLAFAATMVDYSNYSYEPSLGRKASVGRPVVEDFPVTDALVAKALQMADDAAWYRRTRAKRRRKDARIIEKSFFHGYRKLAAGSVDLLVTSPPYLNNYHYNRNTRPQLYWLGFCRSPADLKRLEALNFGTYWQNARERKPIALDSAAAIPAIADAIAQVREQNPGKGIYGGAGWANYAALYFNDCAKFAHAAKWCLRPGATALVVVGNSILQGVHIATDRYLASIAERCGLQAVEIHTPRDTRVGSSIVNSSVRAGTANVSRLYESIVELRQPP